MKIRGPMKLSPLRPGEKIPGDWFPGKIPANIEVGENVRVESSETFRKFESKQPVGLRAGSHTTFCGAHIATFEKGVIEIGEHCYIAEASLTSVERITIGDRVFVAAAVNIVDSDFHPVDFAQRALDAVALAPDGHGNRPKIEARPVVIESDVWIGFGAAIMKGVRIGRGAVIGAGAVVTRNVPAGVVVTGNPAQVLGPVEEHPDVS